MKSILIFWFSIFNIIVLSAQTPEKIKIKCSFQDEPLSLVMVKLRIDHQIQFEYDETLVEDIHVTTSFKKASLDYAMKKILEGTKYIFLSITWQFS